MNNVLNNLNVKNLNEKEFEYQQEVLDYINKYLRRLERIQQKNKLIKNKIENKDTDNICNQIKSRKGKAITDINMTELGNM